VSFGSKRYVCFALLLRIINFFLCENNTTQLNKSILEKVELNSSLVTQRLLDIIKAMSLDSNILKPIEINNNNNMNQTKQQNNSDDSDAVFTNCLTLLFGFIISYQESLNFFLTYNELENWIELVLISSPVSTLKVQLSEKLFQIAQISDQAYSKLFSLIRHIIINEQSKLNSSSKCYQLFVLFGKLISIVNQKKLDEVVDVASMIRFFCVSISNLQITEKNSSSPEDEFMNGLMEGTRALISNYPHLKRSFGDILVEQIFHRNLFEMPTVETRAKHDGQIPPRCKTSTSRNIAFSLLLELSKDDNENLDNICRKALLFQQSTSYQSSWSYLPAAYEKTSGFTGLENLGATCYMNSLLQQFFMIDSFRNRLLAVKPKTEEEESILYQLKTIFINLLESEKSYYNPRSFCKVYKVDGEPMKTGVQMDVDEFFNMLLDRYLYNIIDSIIIIVCEANFSKS
jgi:hypothetical protein